MRTDRPVSSSLATAAAQNIEEKKYWLNKLSGEIIKSSFPGDYSKRGKQNRHPAVISKIFPGELFSRLLELSKGSDIRLYITMVGAVSLLLNRYIYNRQEDITLGTTIYRQEMEADFINTVLVLRNTVNPAIRFKEFLVQVGQVIREADSNQNYPIEALLQLLNLDPAADEDFPLFDTAVLWENLHDKRYLSHLHINIVFIFKGIEEGMEVTVEFNSLLYKKNTIERIISHLFNLLKNALCNVNAPLSQIDILPAEEKKEILFGFNDTRVDYSRDKTMHQLFEEQAVKTPGNIAIIDEGNGLTYSRLNERANRLAWELRKRGLKPNGFAAVVMDRSIQMVIGVMAILKAGGAYVPLEPYLPDARLSACLSSLNVESLLTERSRLVRLVPLSEQLPRLKHIVCVDDIDDIQEKKEQKEIEGIFKNNESLLTGEIGKNPGENPGPTASPTDIAYVIFTSGTTGTPKGVVVQHRPVINVIQWVNKTFTVNSSDRLLFVVSLGFDLSVYDIFGILASGASIRVAGNEEIKSPERLLEIIFNEEITFWDSAPAALQMLVPYLPHPLTGTGFNISKSKLRLIFLSGDWIPVTMPELLQETFAGVRVVGLGGATEATIWSNFFFIETVAAEWASIPYGKPLPNARYYILDRYLNPCPIGVPGDLYIGGECLAKGYFNDETLTAKKFIINPFVPGEKMYKTGDLARWFADGNMEFLGRGDNQVKIRGYRIELGEIESRLAMHDHIADAVVLARSDGDGKSDKYLCAYYTADFVLDTDELSQHLAKTLPDYMIPTYFVKIGRIPLTPNGKIDRKALPKPGLKYGENYTAPGNEIEKKLVELWWDILGRDALQGSQRQTSLGIDDNFFQLGGHSLNATALVSKIHKELNVKIPLAEVFKNPTIRAMSRYIESAGTHRHAAVEPVEEKEYYPLSPAQKRLYILQQMVSDNTGYNLPYVISPGDRVEKEKLESLFKRLIERHESLRTSFIIVNEEPVQTIHREVNFSIGSFEIEEEAGVASLFSSFKKPFDLATAPLLRVNLISTGSSRRVLFLDMHHIITDGTSQGVLEKELRALQEGEELLPLRVRYKDFSQWRKGEKEKKNLEQQEKYWLKELEGEIPVLELPTDYPRPVEQSFAGDRANFEIPGEETRALRSMALKGGYTLFMVLAAVVNILLSKLSGQEEIIMGTPIAGRRHADLEKIIGMFVNTLALRNYPAGDRTFAEFLADVKNRVLMVFENQEYPFEEIVDKLSVKRDIGHNPLFDVLFAMQNMNTGLAGQYKETGIEIHQPVETGSPTEYEKIFQTTRFDLELIALEKGSGLFLSFAYRTKLFKKETIKRFILYFKKIVSTAVKEPGIRISEIGILAEEEKNRVLYEFNDTEAEYPKDKTIRRLFEELVERTPDHVALVGSKLQETNHKKSSAPRANLLDACGEVVSIAYCELDEKSGRLARHLVESGVKPGEPVGIMVERSIEMIVGILGILKAGCAYVPLDPQAPPERIHYMLTDSSAKILLTAHEITSSSQRRTFNFPTSPLPHFSTSTPASLAYIIYTSGSSGRSKGVLVEHRNVVRLVKNAGYINYSRQDRLLPTGSAAFDISTFELWGPLLNNVMLLLVSKEVILTTAKLKDVLLKYDISIMHLIPQLFNQMAAQDIELFSGLRYFLVGGDLVNPGAVNRLWNMYPYLKIIHCYGPTENTTFSTAFRVDKGYDMRVPIGKPIANSFAYIVDKYHHFLPVGVPGELCVGGDGLARGYLNQPELTGEKFDHDLKDLWDYLDENKKLLRGGQGGSFLEKSPPGRRRQRLYKTGDLARRLQDGNIEFLGRIDRQVKIRGFRIELAEIENCILKVRDVKEAVVLAREEDGGDKQLCTYFVAAGEYEISGLREYLARELPDYMIPSYFVRMEKIPLTFNGKIDRSALPKPGLKVGKNYTAPRNEIEKKLAVLWSEILGSDELHTSQLKTAIGIDDDFFRLGGHSLKATILVAKIHKVFDVNVSLGEIFKMPKIRELANYIKEKSKEYYRAIGPSEEKEYYPLSSAQKRLYILHKVNPDSLAYNIPGIIPLPGEFDGEKLAETFKNLIKRHESLRTSFHLVNDTPVQVIHDEVVFQVENHKLQRANTGDTGTIIKEFVRLFDLSCAPLLRVGLVELTGGDPGRENRHGHAVLMVDLHHIISDGVSHQVLVTDFLALDKGEELPPLGVQYKDFSQWQNGEKEKENLKGQEEYWLKEFAGEIPVLELPTDYPRPVIQGFDGSSTRFEISAEEAGMLRKIAIPEGSTRFMVLLAIFNILLAKLSNHEDIIVGTPIAGRRHADLEKIIGMFVNTLALRNSPQGEQTFLEFLRVVKEKALEAFENQEYQFEDLVEKVSLTRDTSRNPLFDVMFVLQNLGRPPGSRGNPGEEVGTREATDLVAEDDGHQNHTAKFDLTLTAVERGETLYFILNYRSQLFKKETIARFVIYLRQILATVLENANQKISQIEIITAAEKQRILHDFNDTAAPYPNNKTLHRLFAEQVERTPGHVALVGPKLHNSNEEVAGALTHGDRCRWEMESRGQISDACGGEHLSYREFNYQANRLAHLLSEKGVKPDTLVGIMVESSVEMIVGIMGILKAGGAYMPIDPGYPADRINYMLADSGVKILVNTGALGEEGEKVGRWAGEIYNIEEFLCSSYPLTFLPSYLQNSSTLAYVIYTSGTTGKPKGVSIEHRGVVNYLCWASEYYIKGEHIDFPLYTSLSFDLTVTSIFTPLLTGNSVIIYGDNNTPLEKIAGIINSNRPGIMKLTPAHLKILKEMKPGNTCKIKRLILGGETLESALASDLHQEFNGNIEIYNEYGPTEAAVGCMIYRYSHGKEYRESVPLGVPVNNVKIYLMDKYGHSVVPGVVGEIYISGDGLSRGYLNRPELTAEKFVTFDNRSYKSYRTYIPQRLYKTGDLGRWLPGGNIEFLGRIDHQVKIRGFRIELGEIEAQLLACPGIASAVVIDRETGEGKKSLRAYLVSGQELDIPGLRGILSGTLPGYMIPSSFIRVEKIPLTANGKIDRNALNSTGIEIKAREEYAVPRNEIEKKILETWKEVLKLEKIGVSENFFDLGGTSLDIIRLNVKFKELFKEEEVVQIFRYPTIRSFAEYLIGKRAGIVSGNSIGRTAPVNKMRRADKMSGITGSEIAVIGMAGKFPGAKNIDEFWENLKNGLESLSFISTEEIKTLDVDPNWLKDPNYVKAEGGVLEDKGLFDASFFGYTPKEAEIMDPQVRIFHECAWSALEDAGYDPGRDNGIIGLYAGAGASVYWENLTALSGKCEDLGYFASGHLNNKDFLSSQIAYKLNLKGPCFTVQTACSTSLVAIHLACRGIRCGECGMALAGGIRTAPHKRTGYIYQEGMIGSADGHCRAFDAKAKGTLPGEGAGVVLLKSLADALREGDHIYAIIRGTAINNDGLRKIGYTAPSVEGQAEVIHMAQQDAEVEPESITYVETHGTATELGDPVEIEALKLAFNTGKKNFCAVGSVKTNIGHLDAAAGIAGFIKTVLALKYRLIPPSLHFETPNPRIDFKNSPFFVNNRLREWKPNGSPRRAGVSSFGIGGTNAHVVLEERAMNDGRKIEEKGPGDSEYRLILLSAKTPAALDRVTENLANYLTDNKEISLSDAAYTLMVGRKKFQCRRMLVSKDVDRAIALLSTRDSRGVHTFFAKEQEKPVIFMFPGLGSQYVNMGRELYEKEPVFRDETDHCFEILKSLIDYDIKEILYPGEESAELHEKIKDFVVAQPVIFIFEYALARLAIKWGVKPDAMIGYSFGEYAAACLSGVLSLEDALKLIVSRGKLIGPLLSGAMLSVPLPKEELKPLLSDALSIAIDNGPSCIIAGPGEDIDALAEQLKAKRYMCVPMGSSHALHSKMMAPILQAFAQSAGTIKMNKPQIPYISNLTGTWLTAADLANPAYWAKHLGETVRFADGIKELLKKESAVFIEVGPGRDLNALVGRYFDHSSNYHALNLVRSVEQEIPDTYYLLNKIGQLWLYGHQPDGVKFYSHQPGRRISLPAYPFEKQLYWLEGDILEKGLEMMGKSGPAQPSPGTADWAYLPPWKRSFPGTRNKHKYQSTSNCLIFLNELPFGKKLLEKLVENHREVVMVKIGNAFTPPLNDTKPRLYTINPREFSHYDILFDQLREMDLLPHHIIHCWNLTTGTGTVSNRESFDAAQYLGFYSLLSLVKAMEKQNMNDDMQISLVANHLQEVTGTESLCPGKAPVLGLLKSIPREYPGITCRGIDIILPEPASPGETSLIDLLIEEFTAKDEDVTVAFRDNRRWVRFFDPFRLEAAGNVPGSSRLRKQGVHLVTGGPGNNDARYVQPFKSRPGLMNPYVAPRNLIEKNLVQTWQRLFGFEQIGIDDDFFELGGDSLKAINLVSRLKEIGVYVVLLDVLSNPTINKLSSLIDEKNNVRKLMAEVHEDQRLSQLECIERLNNGFNEKNIFIVHPMHGMVNLYKELAVLLEKNYTVYGIQARGVKPGAMMAENPEQMVNDYLEQILAVQEDGPYIIAGYCIGIVIAYELVRRLEHLNRTVEKLILFNSLAFTDHNYKILRLLEYLPGFVKRAILLLNDKKFKKALGIANPGINGRSSEEMTDEDNLRKEKIAKHLAVSSAHILPLEIIKAPILSILAESSNHAPTIERGFKRMTKSKATVIKIPGDHDSLWEKPYVEKLAEVIINH